jgi:2-polyprenyl-3-methyl-5-hydroxy-6-metoxy-1,4-benzoquinol methylase
MADAFERQPDPPADAWYWRSRVAELEQSLSWRITAPLRFLSRPLFRGKAAAGVAQPAPRPTVSPVSEEGSAAALHAATPETTTPVATVAGSTLKAVCEQYQIHPDFANAVLETFVGADYDRNIGEVAGLFARYDCRRVQLDYAFSSNLRCRDLLAQLQGWGVRVEHGEGRSYLDIGCAYAGFLVNLARRGFEVTGIEMDETYGRLGGVNLKASGVPAKLQSGDFLSEEMFPGEREFDLITCNDVIEHVSDPAACIRKICRLLKPGGAAYLALPNKLSMTNVRVDAHFQRFGLTLLDYFRARAAFAMYSQLPYYEVSDFYEPEWYVNTAKAAGAEAELVYDNPLPHFDIPGEIGKLYAAYADWAQSDAHKLDVLMRHEISREFAAYSARLFGEYGRHLARNSLAEFFKEWIDSPTRVLLRMPE